MLIIILKLITLVLIIDLIIFALLTIEREKKTPTFTLTLRRKHYPDVHNIFQIHVKANGIATIKICHHLEINTFRRT